MRLLRANGSTEWRAAGGHKGASVLWSDACTPPLQKLSLLAHPRSLSPGFHNPSNHMVLYPWMSWFYRASVNFYSTEESLNGKDESWQWNCIQLTVSGTHRVPQFNQEFYFLSKASVLCSRVYLTLVTIHSYISEKQEHFVHYSAFAPLLWEGSIMFSLGWVHLKVSPKQPSGMYVCMYVQ